MIRRLALLAVVIAAAVVVGMVLHDRWYNQTPPELQSAGPGTVRLTGPCCAGAPPVVQQVTLSDGSTVRLQFGATHSGNPRAAQVFVVPPSGAHVALILNEGDQRTVERVIVRVLHVWTEPQPRNEAIDVRVTESG
jgi:hypothetical protein